MPQARLHWINDLGSPRAPGDYVVLAVNGELVRVTRQDIDLATTCGGRCWFTANRHAPIAGAAIWILGAYTIEEDD